MLWLLASGCVFLSRADRAAHLCEVEDADGDGSCAAEDCDDADPEVHPGHAELCNARDDDCDGALDEGLHPDADGDGRGATGATGACFVGWIEDDSDCDDADAAVRPGALERCNGKQDDCSEAWTPETDAGLVTWETDTGWLDQTAEFAEGTSADPQEYVIPETGTVHVCRRAGGENYYVYVRTSEGGGVAALEGEPLRFEGDTGTAAADELPSLSAAAYRTTVVIGPGDSVDVTLASLVVTGGGMQGGSDGAGLRVDEASATLTDVVITANSGTVGGIYNAGTLSVYDSWVHRNTGQASPVAGGIYSAPGSALLVVGSVVSDNISTGMGGGLTIATTDAAVRDTTIEANEAYYGGGGVYLPASPPASLLLIDSVVSGNTSDGGAAVGGDGGGILTYGAVTCRTVSGEAAGIVGNGAEAMGGGVLVGTGGSFVSEGCDLVSNTAGDAPSDVYAAGGTYTFGEEVHIACDAVTGCVEQVAP